MNNRFPVVSLIVILFVAAGLGYMFWKNKTQDQPQVSLIAPPAAERIEVTLTPAPYPDEVSQISTANISPSPVPSPIPLAGSDPQFQAELSTLEQGEELVELLTKEEIARKIVRAVYGLSEGRVVREYRPLRSPEGKFVANKIGRQTGDKEQELFRIAPENDARYSSYIALFSMLNNDTSVRVYRFLLPTLEEAYQELGVDQGGFHSTLIKAIDVLLDAPSNDQAILLVQPSVRFKFSDPELEKLPSAHKLLLRMGVENSEALKLELKAFKKRLETI